MFRLLLFLMVLVTVRAEDEPRPKALDVPKDDHPKVAPEPAAPAIPNVKVECFACSNCDKVFYNTTTKTCPFSPDPKKQNKCVTYVEKYKYIDRPWYIRGCASVRGSCDDIRKAHDNNKNIYVRLTSCHECEGEKCNGVSRSLPMILLNIAIIPILVKFAL